MKISFADQRPSGDFALVIPLAGGKDSKALNLAAEHASLAPALAKLRFTGEAGSAAEQFTGTDTGGPCSSGSAPIRKRRWVRRSSEGPPSRGS